MASIAGMSVIETTRATAAVSARPGPKARKKSSSPTRSDAVPATTISPAVATIGVTRIVAARADSTGERPSRSERRIPER